MQSEVVHNEVKMHDRSWCDPDEVKMDPDCMLSPPDEVRMPVQGEVVGPASIGKFLMKDILYIDFCSTSCSVQWYSFRRVILTRVSLL